MRARWIITIAVFHFLGIVFFVEHHLQKMRPHLNDAAIEHGVQAGIARYAEEYEKGEQLAPKARAARDAALRRFVSKLDKILEEE